MKNIASRIHTLLCACIVVFASGAQCIKVKFGTNDGPIVPPTPEPTIIPSKPYRIPAPVWESRDGDLPDPNANWRPPMFVPNFSPFQFSHPQTTTESSARRFVQAYLPKKPSPQPAVGIQYFQPANLDNGQNAASANQYQATRYTQVVPATVQVPQLSAQHIPGVGLRHFVPLYANTRQHQQPRQEDASQNLIDNNNVSDDKIDEDFALKYEKETRRYARSSQEGSTGYVQPVQYYPVFAPLRLPLQYHYQHI